MAVKTKAKAYEDIRKERDVSYKVLKNTTQLVEIERVYEDGIFKHKGKVYSKAYEFTNNNYQMLDEERQEGILYALAKMYNSLGCDVQLCICNLEKESESTDKEEDVRKSLAKREMEMLIQKRELVKASIETVKMIVATIEAADVNAARDRFLSVELTLHKSFEDMSSKIGGMDAKRRIEILFRLTNPTSKRKISELDKRFVRECLALNHFGYDNNLIKTAGRSGKWYVQLFYIRELPDYLEDDFLTALTLMHVQFSFSMHVRPVRKGLAKEMIMRQLDTVRRQIAKEEDRNNAAGHYHAGISRLRADEESDLNEMLDDLKGGDESFFLSSFTMAVWGRTKEDLELSAENLRAIASERGIEVEEHEVKVREGFVTALPLGLRMTRTLRPMFSTALSGFNPFSPVDVCDRGFYYGVNVLTKRLIRFDRRTMSVGHGMIVGKSGSGKSLFNKMEKTQVILYTDTDEIIIIDPMNEYKAWAEAYGGQFYDCSAGSRFKFNPLKLREIPDAEASEDERRKAAVTRKLNLMNAVFGVIMGEDFTSAHQDTLEMAMNEMYSENKDVSFERLSAGLKRIDTDAAKALSLSLHRLTEGTLSIFSDEETGIEYKRITVFGLGAKTGGSDEATTITMLAILDYVTSRIAQNYNEVTTWIDVDEIQRVLGVSRAAVAFSDFWNTSRKLKAICTALTTTVRNFTSNKAGQDIISASSFRAFFRLEKADRAELGEEYNLTPAQLSYIAHAEMGSAALQIGDQHLEMESRFSEEEKQYSIYKCITTNPYE